MSRNQFLELSKRDIVPFCSILQGVEHVQHMCEVSKAFESEIFGRREFPERPFEA